ncbi:MAG: putative lyase [Verrucomicrobiales bacterium]|nr:putative lyase [Verrucomicrobiales bacterium]
MVPQVIPCLLRDLRAKDSRARTTYIKLASKFRWLPSAESSEVRRRNAVWAFGVLSSNAFPALIPLSDLLVKHQDSGIRAAAAEALYAVGPSARSAVPSLLLSLKDPDPSVRRCSVLSLGHIGSDLNLVIPALEACIADTNSSVVAATIGALGELGDQAQPALPAIEKVWSRLDRQGRMAALWAVKRINLEQSQQIFMEASRASDPWIRNACLRALSRSTNEPQIAVPILMKIAGQTNMPFAPSQLALALGQFGTNAQSSVPMLLDFLETTDGTAQIEVAKALHKIDPAAFSRAGWTEQAITPVPVGRGERRNPR